MTWPASFHTLEVWTTFAWRKCSEDGNLGRGFRWFKRGFRTSCDGWWVTVMEWLSIFHAKFLKEKHCAHEPKTTDYTINDIYLIYIYICLLSGNQAPWTNFSSIWAKFEWFVEIASCFGTWKCWWLAPPPSKSCKCRFILIPCLLRMNTSRSNGKESTHSCHGPGFQMTPYLDELGLGIIVSLQSPLLREGSLIHINPRNWWFSNRLQVETISKPPDCVEQAQPCLKSKVTTVCFSMKIVMARNMKRTSNCHEPQVTERPRNGRYPAILVLQILKVT